MKSVRSSQACIVFAMSAFLASTMAHAGADIDEGHGHSAAACAGFGPQTPRDIDNPKGENKRVFTKAPGYKEMNLCNIHFHKNAEHKAKDYSIYAGKGDGHGYETGYVCNMSKQLSPAELKATAKPICKGEHGDLKPGDTIEVHWVHSSCDVKPGAGLGSCLSSACANPELRVEAQVYTLVNDPKAIDFNTLDVAPGQVNGYYQAKAIPTGTGAPVEFLGSTTGPKYNEACSPLQVTWSVRPQCAKVDINSVGKWCEKNAFAEDHAHGVRNLVTEPKLLSEIK